MPSRAASEEGGADAGKAVGPGLPVQAVAGDVHAADLGDGVVEPGGGVVNDVGDGAEGVDKLNGREAAEAGSPPGGFAGHEAVQEVEVVGAGAADIDVAVGEVQASEGGRGGEVVAASETVLMAVNVVPPSLEPSTPRPESPPMT